MKIRIFSFLFLCIFLTRTEKVHPSIAQLQQSLVALKNNLGTLQIRLTELNTKLKELSESLQKIADPLEEIRNKLIEINAYSHEKFPDEDLKTIFIENNFKEKFSKLANYYSDLTVLIKEFINNVKKPDNWQYKNLEMCSCPSMQLLKYILLALEQTNAIANKFKNKTQQIIHTSLGAGKLLTLYLFAKMLSIVGYSKIRLNAIDPVSFMPAKSYDENERFVKENFANAIQSEGFALHLYKNIYDFLKSNPTKSHSFDLIDPGGGVIDGPKLSLNELASNKDKNELNSYSVVQLKGYRRTFASIFFIASQTNPIIKFSKNGLDRSKKSNFEELQTWINRQFNKARIKPTNIIDTVNKHASKLVKWVNPDNTPIRMQEPLKNTRWFSVDFYHHIWLDFHQLIEKNKASSDPIIFVGDENKITRYKDSFTTDWKDKLKKI